MFSIRILTRVLYKKIKAIYSKALKTVFSFLSFYFDLKSLGGKKFGVAKRRFLELCRLVVDCFYKLQIIRIRVAYSL